MHSPDPIDFERLCQVTRVEIDGMEKRERVRFVNALPGFKSLVLVGTRSAGGQSNVSIVSTAIHLGSDPPLLGMICRPATVARHTYENIQETGIFTFNQVSEDFYPAAHQTSARYDRNDSEFQSVGLTEAWHTDVAAPFVGQARLRIALRLVETIPVRANGVTLLVGEVTHVFFPPEIREQDGHLELESAGVLAGAGVDGYYRPGRLARLSYAKVDRSLHRFARGIGGTE